MDGVWVGGGVGGCREMEIKANLSLRLVEVEAELGNIDFMCPKFQRKVDIIKERSTKNL